MNIKPVTSSQIFIFDIDGVLTNPISKKADNLKLFTLLNDLPNKIPIIFNTGRSAEWVCKNILPHLNIANNYNKFFASCEMGAVSLTIDSEGKTIVDINEDTLSQQIPDQLRDSIIDMVNQNYINSMFVDNTKKVIMTVEMVDNYPINNFEIDKIELKNSIEIILKHYHPNLHVRPSSSTIAIDIKPTYLNKSHGAMMIHRWLINNNYNLANTLIYCFGDSASDIEMCDYLYNQNINTCFVYVGEDNFNTSKPYKIIQSQLPHSEGTYSYLNTVV